MVYLYPYILKSIRVCLKLPYSGRQLSKKSVGTPLVDISSSIIQYSLLQIIVVSLHHLKHVNYHKQHILYGTKVSWFIGFHPNTGKILQLLH